MRWFVGTSGFSYKEWKGKFYPSNLSASKMLAFYAGQFNTVEINNSFYRMPASSMLEKWYSETPAHFSFVLKGPQRITHFKKLNEVGNDVRSFFDAAAKLKEKIAAALFQFPPFLQRDLHLFGDFISILPDSMRIAMEFRHRSWYDEKVYEILRTRNLAICSSDTDESP